MIYEDWARLIALKTSEAVFKGDYSISSNSLTPIIEIFDNALPANSLNKVIVLANFDVTSQTMNTTIPSGQTWYDLMDDTGNTTFNATTVTIPAGQFRIFGNGASTLNTDVFDHASDLVIYPNPVQSTFKINSNSVALEVYDLTGKRLKSFEGKFSPTDSFEISDLYQGIYLIKIKNSNGQIATSKLIKL